MDTTTTVPIYYIPKDSSIGIDQSAVPTVFASGVSPDSIPWSTAEDIIRDIVREGPFDVGATPMETEDSPLINTSMPGCPYRMTSYTGTALVDADTTYGLQLHHPRFLEFIGAPESARLLNNSPSFWVDRLGQERAMAAAVNLQRDAGFMMSKLQILEQFVMSLHRMSAEMLSIGVDHVVFPVEEVDKLSVMPRAQRAAQYMTVMGLWRPPSGLGGSRKPTEGRGFYDVETSNSGTVCNVVASDVSGNVEYWCGSCGVSGGGGGQAVGDAEGPASSQIHDSDGPVAPSVGSGCFRAIADVDLPFLYELRVLLWQKGAIGSVTILTI